MTDSTSLLISDCSDHFTRFLMGYLVMCWSDNYIHIDCNNKFLIDLPDIKINLDFVSHTRFWQCDFSSNMRVQNVLDSMNDTASIIQFMHFKTTPYRFNFKNFSSSQLHLANSDISELPYDLFYDVTYVRTIRIDDTKLVRIPKAFFSDWAKNLWELYVVGNKLRKIAKHDFTHLVNLAILDLALNEIDEIELGAFDNLIHIRKLYLSSNRLHILPAHIFRNLSALTNFYLTSQYFSKNIQNLTITQVTSVPSDGFYGAFGLRLIKFRGHNLKTLPLELFDGNKYLISLDLQKNGLESLPTGIFKELERLKNLDISNNRLTNLTLGVFIELHSLEALNVSVNNLTQIDPKIFLYISSAINADLSYNQIAIIQTQSKGEFPGAYLSMINRLESIYKKGNLRTQISVNMTYNSFTEFNSTFLQVLKYIAQIDLSNNHISYINLTGIVSELAKLSRFQVNATEMRYVPIFLGNNPLNCDCYLMKFIHYLNDLNHLALREFLFIFMERRDQLHKSFTCSMPPKLKDRDVRKVYLEEFPCPLQTTFSGDACTETCTCQEYPGKQVISVDCSNRNLTQLPVMINNEKNWFIELNMSTNTLHHLPFRQPFYFHNVSKLDLSYNNISSISLELFSPTLQELRLHNNSISRIDSNIIQFLVNNNNKLRKLTLHGNKWICDCKMYKNLQSFVRKILSRYNFHEILCYGTNRTVYENSESEICDDTNIMMISISFLIAFFGILVGSLAAFYYRYQKQIKIWLYSRNLCLRFITDEELDKDKQYDAFISFSHKDEDFIEKEIVANLEEGPRPYKLCLHYRDWLAGEWIPLQISRSVADSRRTIIILTPNFLESVWGLVEFRTAHIQALKDGRSRLIIILCGETNNLDGLDQELKDYLSLYTYIKWGDPWFWQKFKYALPHRSRGSRKIANHDAVHYRVTNDLNFDINF